MLNIRKLWDGIINDIEDVCIDLSIEPKSDVNHACFNVSTDGKTIYFDCSVIDEHSSKIEIHRKLNFKVFQNSYTLLKKNMQSDVTDISIEELYYFSEINI